MSWKQWLTAVVVAAAGASVAMASAGNLGWHWVSPLPPGVGLMRTTSANGLTVAVGEHGTIVTSPDGLRWTLEESGTSADLSGLGWCDGRFVAVGFDDQFQAVILGSGDGHTWLREHSPQVIGGYFFDLACGGGRTVVVGGSTWTLAKTGDGPWELEEDAFPERVESVAWNGAVFLAVGLRGSFLSEDGVHWRRGADPV
jgi:hypothetical protein